MIYIIPGCESEGLSSYILPARGWWTSKKWQYTVAFGLLRRRRPAAVGPGWACEFPVGRGRFRAARCYLSWFVLIWADLCWLSWFVLIELICVDWVDCLFILLARGEAKIWSRNSIFLLWKPIFGPRTSILLSKGQLSGKKLQFTMWNCTFAVENAISQCKLQFFPQKVVIY